MITLLLLTIMSRASLAAAKMIRRSRQEWPPEDVDQLIKMALLTLTAAHK